MARVALVTVLLACAAALGSAEVVPVQHTEGLIHGFLVLRSADGTLIANGDLIQNSKADRVSSRIVYHFKDGSLQDETAVYTEHDDFRLVTDHLVQKGPSFPKPMDMSIDAATGQVIVHYTDDHGQAKEESERMALPPDIANGLVLTLLKNVTPDHLPASFSFIAATPKPMLIKLALSTTGADKFSTGSMAREAQHFVLKVDIGGIKGILAPIFGKQPPDIHVWVLQGTAPAFVRAEQQFYYGGPVWRIDLASPQGL
ncbi:MAG TPA: hypothetical protein VHZ73_10560 [Vicinamibacterales bacterium]|jgi:hypothetical protein|nr:hypothetical protein [Vicinamibacterales bacterium]